jgi:hypothetical protein
VIELVELVQELDPDLVELCSEHAARLTPPLGWTIAGRPARESVA